METKRTNKELLVKGLQQMGIALALLISGPILLHLVLINKDKPFFIPLFIIGIIICGLAIYFIFKGLKTIMSSLFD